MSTPLLIARTLEKELYLLPAMANRHGLITGATGTGKTVTLQKLAESLSEIGVPVFMADVKGDLTGVAQEGTASEKLLERLKNIGITDWTPHGNPVVVWDIFGEKGHPVRATVSELIEGGKGVCQDFAHLAVGCLRAAGLPARYVSGYLETAPPPCSCGPPRTP